MNKQNNELATKPLYTIGIAAEMVGLSVHSLRLYEAEGLMIPFKTASRRRLYSDLEIHKAKSIHRMIREEGLNFEGIRRLIALVPCCMLRECKAKNAKQKIENCANLKNRTSPCWSTDAKCIDPLPSCRECPVYRNINTEKDIQAYISQAFVEWQKNH